MEEIVCDLSKKEGADFDLRFAVLTFGKNCVWQTGESLKKFDGNWPCLMIDEAEDVTQFNTACKKLKEKLSGKHGFFNFAIGKTITPPIIILLTDGYANDGDLDGKDGIDELKKNKYFNESYKLAIVIDDDANQRLCINFTGDKELVFTAYNEKALRESLKSDLLRGLSLQRYRPYWDCTSLENSTFECNVALQEEGGMIGSEKQRTEEVNRKVTPVFFLIDVSESMSGKKIDIVNNSMETIMRDLSNMNSADFDLRFAVLSFETNCVWETGDSLIKCTGVWQPLKTSSGVADFNVAYRELNEKLSGKHGFFNFATGKTITPPIIVLLTDGFANDGDSDGKDGIEELKKNKYFNGSYELAIAIGDDANQQLCINFTGDKELVFANYNKKAFENVVYDAGIAYS